MRIGLFDFSITFFTRVLVLLTALGSQSCLAWVLGPSGRGAYAVCIIFIVILTLIFMIGCDSACIYFVASKSFNISEGFFYACIYSAIGSCLAVITGLLIMEFPFVFLTKATHEQFYIAIAAIPFGIFSTILVGLFIAQKEIACFSFISIAQVVVQLLLTLILVWLFRAGVEGALFANISSELVSIIMSVYFLRTRFHVSWASPNLSGMKKVLVYGSKYYIGKISNQSNAQMGTIIMAFFSNAAEIGIFSVAMRLMTQAMIIPDSLNKVLSPRIAGDQEGRKDLIARCFRLVFFSCGGILLLIALLAQPIVTLLFSPAFLPAVPLIQVLAIGMTLRCGSKMLEPYLLGTNRPGTASLSVASGVVVNILLLYILLPKIGTMGAAIAVVGSHLTILLIMSLAFLRHTSFGIADLIRPRVSDFNQIGDSFKAMLESLTKKSQMKEEKRPAPL